MQRVVKIEELGGIGVGNYMVYWKPSTVDCNLGMGEVNHTASNQYDRIRIGDVLWIVSSLGSNNLVLVGRQKVDRILDQDEAEALLGSDTLWIADYHVISEAPEELRLIDISDLAKRLRFIGTISKLPDGFSGKNLQTMRKLAPTSAELVQELWDNRKNLPPYEF